MESTRSKQAEVRSSPVAIGIDIGKRHTAIATIRKDGSSTGLRIDRSSKPRDFQHSNLRMLRQVQKEISSAVNYCILGPDEPPLVVACERMVNMRGIAAAELIAWEWAVRQAVLLDCHARCPKLLLLPTGGQLKQFVSSRGDCDKDEIGRWVVHHWPEANMVYGLAADGGDDPRMMTQDEIEAYALAKFALCRRQFEAGEISRDEPGPWAKYQVDIAAKDRWSKAKSNLMTIADDEETRAAEDENFHERGELDSFIIERRREETDDQ
jgi:hypothetical protein